jgi:hypothetical protein
MCLHPGAHRTFAQPHQRLRLATLVGATAESRSLKSQMACVINAEGGESGVRFESMCPANEFAILLYVLTQWNQSRANGAKFEVAPRYIFGTYRNLHESESDLERRLAVQVASLERHGHADLGPSVFSRSEPAPLFDSALLLVRFKLGMLG